MKILGVSISIDNKKLGAIPSLSFPVGITCAECARSSCLVGGCYAARMCRVRPSIAEAWRCNLEAWQTRPEDVKKAIISQAMISRFFRYFIGGDIPDAAFFAAMVEIARACTSCTFLAFTKKYEIVNAYAAEFGADGIPSNLQIIFSKWRADIPNPYAFPTSRVLFTAEEIETAASVCGGNCADCICRGVSCWSLKKGEEIAFIKH